MLALIMIKRNIVSVRAVYILMIFNTCILAECTVYNSCYFFKFVIALRYVLLCFFSLFCFFILCLCMDYVLIFRRLAS